MPGEPGGPGEPGTCTVFMISVAAGTTGVAPRDLICARALLTAPASPWICASSVARPALSPAICVDACETTTIRKATRQHSANVNAAAMVPISVLRLRSATAISEPLPLPRTRRSTPR
jgi:hypothetical protein